MEALRNALAILVAAEARVTELVNPIEQIADAVKAVVKEGAIVLEEMHERVEHLEAASPTEASPAVVALTEALAALGVRLTSIESSVSSLSSRVSSMGTDIGTLFARTQPLPLADPKPATDQPAAPAAQPPIADVQSRIETAIDDIDTAAAGALQESVHAPVEGSGT